MSETAKHRECHNYAPIDVVKGICHLSKEAVLADDDACPSLERLPRCLDCQLFTPAEEEYIGTCGATPDRPMTYPDLVAVACEWFKRRDG